MPLRSPDLFKQAAYAAGSSLAAAWYLISSALIVRETRATPTLTLHLPDAALSATITLVTAQDIREFDYDTYLRVVLRRESEPPLFVATEADFGRGPGLAYPYRSYFYALGLMHENGCRLRVGFRDFDVNRRALTLVGPGIARLWLENDWQVRNTTLFFTPELFSSPLDARFLRDYSFFQPGAQHVLHLSEAHYRNVTTLLQMVQHHVQALTTAAGLLYALLEHIADLYPAYDVHHADRPHGSLIQDLTRLLHVHFREHKDAGFYAEAMHLATKHLSAQLKAQTGRTLKQLIDDYVLFEAKSLLKQTELSVKEITY